MRGTNHKIISTGIVFLCGAPPEAVVGAFIGSTLPDIDHKLGIPHRTWTHWLPAYVIVLGLLFLTVELWTSPLATLAENFAIGTLAGAALHIGEDAFTVGGVPLLTPSGPRSSFRWTKTGGRVETVMSLAVVGSVMTVILLHPHETFQLYSTDVHRIFAALRGIS